MALTGEIATRAAAELPYTWAALASHTNVFGEEQLQRKVDLVKFQLFGTVVDPEVEADLYDPNQLTLAAKLIALELIPAGIEFWSNQLVSKQTVQPSERLTYPDRIKALQEVYARLQVEVRDLEAMIGAHARRKRRRGPEMVSPSRDLRSADPNRFIKEEEYMVSSILR